MQSMRNAIIANIARKSYRAVNKLKQISKTFSTRLRVQSFGNGVQVAPTAILRSPEGIVIGDGVAIGDFVHIWGGGGVTIGENSLIAANTVLASESHDPDALSRSALYRQSPLSAPIYIGANVWISSGVVVGPGVSIGDNSIVAAGAVVLRDVPANVLVAGIPARLMRALV